MKLYFFQKLPTLFLIAAALAGCAGKIDDADIKARRDHLQTELTALRKDAGDVELRKLNETCDAAKKTQINTVTEMLDYPEVLNSSESTITLGGVAARPPECRIKENQDAFVKNKVDLATKLE